MNEINVIMDKDTGRARGFAFATMNTEEAAKAAILGLNGKDWKGRALTVNEAVRVKNVPPEGAAVTAAGSVLATDSSGRIVNGGGVLVRRIPLARPGSRPPLHARDLAPHPQPFRYGKFFSKHSR